MRIAMKNIWAVLTKNPCDSCTHRYNTFDQPPCKKCEIVFVPTKYELEEKKEDD